MFDNPSRNVGKSVVHPLHRSEIPSTHQVVTVDPYTTQTSFNGQKVHFRIPVEQLEKVSSLVLRYEVSETGESNSITCVPATYFAEDVELKDSKNKEIVTEYADITHFLSCAVPDQDEQTPEYKESINLSKNWYQGEDATIPASGSRIYYVRVWSAPLNYEMPYMRNLKKYLQVVVTLRNGIVASGTGTAGLTSIKMLLDNEVLPSQIRMKAEEMKNQTVHWQYLDWVHVQETSKTMTASTKFTVDLDSVNGHCPALIFAIRADSYGATSQGLIKYKDLGPTATVDLEDSTGTSILGSGTAIDLAYLKSHHWQKHFNNRFNNRNFYILPLCANFRRALMGDKSGGYFPFDGSKYRLAITPSAPETDCVQTVNLNNAANDGGYYKLSFRGETTDSLAFNANAAAIKAALEALPSFQDWDGQPLTVTADGAATTDFNLTFDSQSSRPPNRDLVQLVVETLNDGGIATAPDFASTSVTTYGRSGWTTGTNTIDVYCPIFRSKWERNGVMKFAIHV